MQKAIKLAAGLITLALMLALGGCNTADPSSDGASSISDSSTSAPSTADSSTAQPPSASLLAAIDTAYTRLTEEYDAGLTALHQAETDSVSLPEDLSETYQNYARLIEGYHEIMVDSLDEMDEETAQTLHQRLEGLRTAVKSMVEEIADAVQAHNPAASQ